MRRPIYESMHLLMQLLLATGLAARRYAPDRY